MKKRNLVTMALTALCSTAIAQPPVTSGLKLYLEASSYNANGASAATWTDLSGSGNHITAGNATTAEPTYTTNAGGSGLPGVTFDGNSDYMFRSHTTTTGFNTTSATLFVVRVANTATATVGGGIWPTTLSIGDNSTFNNEFALMGDWAQHSSTSGNWVNGTHQCYSSLPNNAAAITTAVLNTGTTSNDTKLYINGIAPTTTANTQGSPGGYTAAARSILVGASYGSTSGSVLSNAYFNGHILEVLAYNRVLTATEIQDVSDYLKCKYQINYSACNVVADCTPQPAGCDDRCYWRVTGNNINGSNNIFGTLTNDAINIQTNAANRGIITSGTSATAGFLGWNTMSPTARLHVNCLGGNNESSLSDIRFENLEQGTGNILAIDNNGYVYNTGITAGTGSNSLAWNLTGNTPTLSQFFGTTGGQDIRIRTWNTQRGVITSGTSASSINSGFFGWNTATPTARWHVNCYAGNETPGTSDIRFENLEQGTGNILAIDANGYVYNTGVPAGGGGAATTAWDVNGNSIVGGANHLGTNSPDDVLLRTSGNDKGIMTSGAAGDPFDDGRLGWQTLNPTAHLHINCIKGNPDDGSNGSDVRFERLEPGQGNIMVIDDQGYVYNSHVRLTPDGGIEPGAKMMQMYNEEKTKVDELQKELEALKTQMNELMKQNKSDVITPTGDASKLYQNTPNPFGKETNIEYYVYQMQESAFIMIYDLNGRELAKYPITQKGKGSITVNAQNLISGMYLYALIVDGREIDSKRMVLVK